MVYFDEYPRALQDFPCGSAVKNPPAGDVGDMSSIPGSGRSPGDGHGDPLQHSCLKNPLNRGVWQAPWGRKQLDTGEATEHTCTYVHFRVHVAAVE